MKGYWTILLLITLFSLGDARAQNLTQMVEKAAREPAPTNATVTDAIVNLDEPVVKIEIVGLRGHFFKSLPSPKVSKTIIDRATEITHNAYYQRRRFEETGQPIEIDQDHIYYRRDAFSYTKGIILCSLMNGRIDFGLFRKHFSPASTLVTGKMTPYFNQEDSNALIFRNGSRIFFSLRVKIPTP